MLNFKDDNCTNSANWISCRIVAGADRSIPAKLGCWTADGRKRGGACPPNGTGIRTKGWGSGPRSEIRRGTRPNLGPQSGRLVVGAFFWTRGPSNWPLLPSRGEARKALFPFSLDSDEPQAITFGEMQQTRPVRYK